MERKNTEVTSSEPYQKKVKVLLVDDKVSEILPLKSMMQFLNCDIEVAQSGAEALQSIILQKFDLVVVDWMMPILDGKDTLQLFHKIQKNDAKRDEAFKPTLFVIHTGVSPFKVEVPWSQYIQLADIWPKADLHGSLLARVESLVQRIRRSL